MAMAMQHRRHLPPRLAMGVLFFWEMLARQELVNRQRLISLFQSSQDAPTNS